MKLNWRENIQMVKGALIQALSVTEGGKAFRFLVWNCMKFEGYIECCASRSTTLTVTDITDKERIELTLKWKFKCDN